MKIKPIHQNHAVSSLVFHLVFATKYRLAVLPDTMTVEVFKKAIAKYPITLLVAEIVYDHVHLMLQTPTHYSPANIARLVKGCSSHAIKQILPTFPGWSKGYYISTVGNSDISIVENYIRTQKD